MKMRASYILPVILASFLIPAACAGEPQINMRIRSLNVTQNGPDAVVEAEVWLESSPPEVEYCSVDVLVDGRIAEGVCWSSLPEVPWAYPGVSAPTALTLNTTVRLSPGTHELSLRGYARNTAGSWVEASSGSVTLTHADVEASPRVAFSDVRIVATDASLTASALFNYTGGRGVKEYGYGLLLDGEEEVRQSWEARRCTGCETSFAVYKKFRVDLPGPVGTVQLFATVTDIHNNTAYRTTRAVNLFGHNDQGSAADGETPAEDSPGVYNYSVVQVPLQTPDGDSAQAVTLYRLVGVEPGPTPWLQAPEGKVKLTVSTQPYGEAGVSTAPEPGVYFVDEGSTVLVRCLSSSVDWVFREWAVGMGEEGSFRALGAGVEITLRRDAVVTALHSQVLR